MSGIEKVTVLAKAHGWWPIGRHGNTHTFFKWRSGIRVELHVAVDAAGRIEAVSLWHNERKHLFQEAGVRAHAERLIQEES